MTLDNAKEFFTQLFTHLSVEDSIYILAFLFISYLLGLLFGRWSRASNIRRLKRELEAKNKDLIMLRAENGSFKEQLEIKEEELYKLQHELEENKGRTRQLEEENSHLSSDLDSCQRALSTLKAENTSNLERIDELHKVVADLQYKNDELTALADQGAFQSDEMEHLQDTFELTTNRINALEVKLSRLENENQRLRNELQIEGSSTGTSQSGNYNIDVIAIKTRLEQLEKENNRLAKVLSNIQVVNADLEADTSQITATEELSIEERSALARTKLNNIIGNKIPKASFQEKDDLKQINGIGPFIEKKLNDIGIFTFRQISRFDKEIIDAVTNAIQFFPGRIERDDWVGQAKKLMG